MTEKTITIYYPEGTAACTQNVEAHDASSHIRANDRFSEEAHALLEFRSASGIPRLLLGGAFVLQAEGAAESGAPYARYVRVVRTFAYWTDGTDTGIAMRALDKGRSPSLIAMVQGDHRDSSIMYDALEGIPYLGARHRVLAGFGLTPEQYREAFDVPRHPELIRTWALDDFTTAYIECALWSSMDDDAAPLEDRFGIEDIARESLAEMVSQCADFQEEYADYLAQAGSAEQNGYDFWLTRNRHGAGFWDRGYPDKIDKPLTDAAHAYGSVNIYVGDDNKVHLS